MGPGLPGPDSPSTELSLELPLSFSPASWSTFSHLSPIPIPVMWRWDFKRNTHTHTLTHTHQHFTFVFILNGFGVKKLRSALQTILVYLEAPKFQPSGGLKILGENLNTVIFKPYFLNKTIWGNWDFQGTVWSDRTSRVAALAFGRRHAERDYGALSFLSSDCHTHAGWRTHPQFKYFGKCPGFPPPLKWKWRWNHLGATRVEFSPLIAGHRFKCLTGGPIKH